MLDYIKWTWVRICVSWGSDKISFLVCQGSFSWDELSLRLFSLDCFHSPTILLGFTKLPIQSGSGTSRSLFPAADWIKRSGPLMENCIIVFFNHSSGNIQWFKPMICDLWKIPSPPLFLNPSLAYLNPFSVECMARISKRMRFYLPNVLKSVVKIAI